jgi:hypothetical protein
MWRSEGLRIIDRTRRPRKQLDPAVQAPFSAMSRDGARKDQRRMPIGGRYDTSVDMIRIIHTYHGDRRCFRVAPYTKTARPFLSVREGRDVGVTFSIKREHTLEREARRLCTTFYTNVHLFWTIGNAEMYTYFGLETGGSTKYRNRNKYVIKLTLS